MAIIFYIRENSLIKMANLEYKLENIGQLRSII